MNARVTRAFYSMTMDDDANMVVDTFFIFQKV